jgi:hypothetical protein
MWSAARSDTEIPEAAPCAASASATPCPLKRDQAIEMAMSQPFQENEELFTGIFGNLRKRSID